MKTLKILTTLVLLITIVFSIMVMNNIGNIPTPKLIIYILGILGLLFFVEVSFDCIRDIEKTDKEIEEYKKNLFKN